MWGLRFGGHMADGRFRLRVLALAVFALAQAGIAQDKSATWSAGVAASARSEASSGPAHEGITVHGQWTIILRNPDGTVASKHKFENSLAAEGATLLVRVLSRQRSVQYWQIRLINKDGCVCSRGGNRVDCGILDSQLTPDVSSDFATLTVSAPTSGANAGKLVLSGTAPASFDGQIKTVNTSVGNTCAPTACSTDWSVFTVAFPTPISVQAGQTMDVTVVISFS